MTFRGDPVHKAGSGYQWGRSGKIYPTKEQAQRQAAAIFASGWREDAQVRKAVKALRAPQAAESRYVLDLAGIMGAVHKGIMAVVEREHLGGLHEDGTVLEFPPLVGQTSGFSCGAAAALSVLKAHNPTRFAGVREADLRAELGTTPDWGTEPQAIADVLSRELGAPASVRYPSTMAELEAAVDRDEPPIVAVQAWQEGPKKPWETDWDDGHYLVLAAYDAERLTFMDPASKDYAYIPRAEFVTRWHDVLRDGTKVQHPAIFCGARGAREDALKPRIGLSDRLLGKIVKYQTPRVKDAYTRMADHVAEHGAEQAMLLGIAPRAVAGLESVIEHAREENVQLITRASSDLLERIRNILTETEGQAPREIAKQLAPLDGIGKRRGMLIARTETSKLNSQLVQHRARAAGLSKYRWSGALDERERDSHRALEGKVFSWDNPPDPEALFGLPSEGEGYHPGETFNCRCVPLPFIEELEEAVGEGEEEPEVLAGEGEEEEPVEGEEGEEPDEEEEPDLEAGEDLPDEEAQAEGAAAEAIDWPEVENIQREASELAEAGDLDMGTWEELRERALAAAAGDEEAVASLDLLRPDAADVVDGSDDQPRDERGRWSGGTFTEGTHAKEVFLKGVGKREAAEVTKHFEPYTDILEKRPLNIVALRAGGGVFGVKGNEHQAAYYNENTKSLVVNTKAGAEDPLTKSNAATMIGGAERGYGGAIQRPHAIGDLGTTDKERVARTAVHELGHHMHGDDPEAERVMQNAFTNPDAKPVSDYGKTNPHEYFAESFAAHHFHPEELKQHDPVGHEMVEKVLSMRRGHHDAYDPDQPRDELGRFGSGGGEAKAKEEPGLAPKTHFASVTDAETRRAEVREKLQALNADLSTGEVSPESYIVYRKQIDEEMDAIGDQTFTPEQVVSGLHHEGLSKWLEKPENKPDLELVRYLGPNVGGDYHPNRPPDYDQGRIRVPTNIYDGLKHPVEPLPLGEASTVTNAAIHGSYSSGAPVSTGKLDRVQTNFIHELGHHVHMCDEFTVQRAGLEAAEKAQAAGEKLTSYERPHSDFEIVDKTIEQAYDSHGFDKTTSSGDPLRDHVLVGDQPSPAVSRYAATNSHEYFAETFAAYMQNAPALEAHDKVGYDMVKRVLKIRGIE